MRADRSFLHDRSKSGSCSSILKRCLLPVSSAAKIFTLMEFQVTRRRRRRSMSILLRFRMAAVWLLSGRPTTRRNGPSGRLAFPPFPLEFDDIVVFKVALCTLSTFSSVQPSTMSKDVGLNRRTCWNLPKTGVCIFPSPEMVKNASRSAGETRRQRQTDRQGPV